MIEVMTIGEIICEVMREKIDEPLGQIGTFLGPYPSGAPAIYIDTMAKLGHKSGMFASVGDDEFGRAAIRKLEGDGVICDYINKLDDIATSVVFVAYESNGERDFMFYLGNAASGRIEIKKELPNTLKAFHISGPIFSLSEQVAETSLELVQKYSKMGSLITFDPNWRVQLMTLESIKYYFDKMLIETDLFFPSNTEIMLLTGKATVEDAVQDIWNNANYNKMKYIIVKYGKEGSKVFSRTESFFVPVYKIEEIDPTGAGDSYDAGFTSAYLSGKSIQDCADFASQVAAINTKNIGGMSAKLDKNDFNELLNLKEL